MKEILCKLENITKKYKDGKDEITALQEVNLEIHKGDFIGIIGPSGSGKSTFLSIIGGLLKPTTGKLIINNVDFYSKKDKEKSRIRFNEIGFILQTSNLVPFLKIKDQFKLQNNYKREKFDKKNYQKLIDYLKLNSIVKNYPSDISGGQKQRCAIALALYKNPDLILADEPTASLDSKTAFETLDLLKELTKKENKTTMMVTHDERMLKYCDLVYEINDGLLMRKNF